VATNSPDPTGEIKSQTPATTQAERLSPEEEEYLELARLLVAGRVPVLDGAVQVGRLEGGFRIVQMLSPSSMILDRVAGEFDETLYTVRVDGISAAGNVDGARVQFGNIIVRRKGTWTYTTVLGAGRTIHWMETLNSARMAWAVSRVKEIENRKTEIENRKRQDLIQKAQAAVDELTAQLKKIDADSFRIPIYIDLQAEIAQWQPLAKAPTFAAKVAAAKEGIKNLGNIGQADVDAYKEKRARLVNLIEEAQKSLQELERGE
jgi:ribosomal protein L27